MPAPEAVGIRYSKGVLDVNAASFSGMRTAVKRYTVVPNFILGQYSSPLGGNMSLHRLQALLRLFSITFTSVDLCADIQTSVHKPIHTCSTTTAANLGPA